MTPRGYGAGTMGSGGGQDQERGDRTLGRMGERCLDVASGAEQVTRQ